jgi:hypothetical protein
VGVVSLETKNHQAKNSQNKNLGLVIKQLVRKYIMLQPPKLKIISLKFKIIFLK